AVAVVSLAGCYASTEPATDITFSGATFNARGTANDGPASAYFEYGPTSLSGFETRTASIRFPAGASGPFSAKPFLGPLYAGTEYKFRVCGRDDRLNSPPARAHP